MKVVGLTGFAQSGKDTAAGFLQEFGYQRRAFADILRQSLYNLDPPVTFFDADGQIWRDGEGRRVRDIVDDVGWDVAKVEFPEIRALLQRLGTEVGRDLYGESFWVDRVINEIKSWEASSWGNWTSTQWVITDVRFPNEYAAVKDLGGEIWRIQRPGVGAVNNHVSEQVLPYDLIIPNTGDLVQFRANVLGAAGIDLE